MRITIALAAALVAALYLAPQPLMAQEDQPEFHYMTFTTFDVPLGEERGKVMMWVDTVMVPLARLNPHVQSYRVGTHIWGDNAMLVVVMAEYATWEDINADCGAPCEEWMEQNQPEEGSEREEKWDDIQATFLKYYGKHKDEILVVSRDRMK